MEKGFITVTIIIALLSSAACTPILQAEDTLILKGNRNYEGTFQSYKNEKFYFAPDAGKPVNEFRSSAQKLSLDPPSKVTVTPRVKKKITDMKLKGYEKSNFIFEKNGSEISMPASQIASIIMGLDFDRAANAPSYQNSGNDANSPLTINLKELTEWIKEGNPTPAQTEAFENYKTTRTTYDEFLAASAALIKEMDKSRGPAREDLLNKLRKRKNDEQPLIGRLKKYEKALLAAFPEIKGPPEKQ